MSEYHPEEWVEFGVALAGAAAVLAGLVFVSVSINLDKVLEIHGLPGRAGESIVMFAGVLILSVCLLMPGQSRTALGVELLVGGVLLMALLVLIALPGLNRPTRQPLSWRVTRIVLALAASVPVIVAGVSLLAESGGGLYWLAAGFILALAAGIGNAWVLLVEVVRDERYLPVRPDRGDPEAR
jgi:modulator of FtsH protease